MYKANDRGFVQVLNKKVRNFMTANKNAHRIISCGRYNLTDMLKSVLNF